MCPILASTVPVDCNFKSRQILFFSSTDAEEFINLVEQLEASGGADQREPMIAAMRAAAIRCPVRSTIFLFTA